MKPLLRCLVVTMAFWLSGEATAEVVVKASPSCGDWVKTRKEGGWPEIANNFWLVGYFSGAASGTGKEFWGGFNTGVGALDHESVFLWMDKYCNNNPLKKVHEGAELLWLERILTAKKTK